MPPKRRRFLLDIESTSTVDLRAAGAFTYWAHPVTKIICVRYRIDNGPVATWRPGNAVPYFCTHEINDFRVVAHNYLFEYAAWWHQLSRLYGWFIPNLSSWDCTMARALYWGLPAGLGDACDALSLPVTKDAQARPLMLRMSRPRAWDPDTNKHTWWHETDPDKLDALIEYCKQDVLAECALDDALPELPKFERELFILDGEINLRGIGVDLPLVKRLQAYTATEANRLNLKMQALTGNRVRTTNQVAAIQTEIESLGETLPDLSKETVADALKDLSKPSIVRRILLCRQEAAKSSTAKLKAIQAGAGSGDRCLGLLQYGGAGRTMRWAGRRAQPHNLYKGTVKGLESIYPLIEAGILLDDLAMLVPGSIMELIASAVRGCFVASPGHVLVSGDLSQIEARVLPWLANQDDVLEVFRRGEDIYIYQARKQGSENRQFGKVLVLACGFGMGATRFQETAATYGVDLSLSEAEQAVNAWRATNDRSVQLWWDVDRAFRFTARCAHGSGMQVGQFLKIRKTGKAVRIVLPSTHEITYQQVELQPNPQDPSREDITFMGVDQTTKKWSRQRTYGGKLVENIVQAVARDVLGEAMKRVGGTSLKPVLTVHDELLVEVHELVAEPALRNLLAHMTLAPAWAPGLPVAAEGWFGRRYRK